MYIEKIMFEIMYIKNIFNMNFIQNYFLSLYILGSLSDVDVPEKLSKAF